ncbi:branched-chain amino acid ABC transporter permease [Limnohabitans sp. JirII-31]|uniref:branched-chain amino acid ABC transporter permease n=1 Tax=Limnohabitans sp. JirII-31 TaxID=1977908 RepID=UPI000C1E39E5|nr:branched-chain amino acid ABC transporter permease [Limnohabitans sp. JirII-31]PIT77398.1 branched-chain amino acid ABC transporter permease [Limnohabitans sp. JirII-31]
MNRLWVLLGIVFLAVLPLVSGEYFVNLGSQILITVIFASSLNLLVGYAGLTSLGHATYMGLSAYISAWLSIKMGLDHTITAPAALLLTTLIGMVFGWIALRATGLGFLMLTLALSQIVWGLGYRWVSVTNGDNGLSGLTRPHPFGIDLDISNNFYWFALIITCACIYAISVLIRSPFGASIRGTRDQARRMSALGYNVWAIRWTTFVIASFLGAVAGLLYVYFHKYIHPSVMAITVSAEALLCVIAGGSGTLAGPLLGALVVVVLKNYASAYVERWNMLLGLVFLFIVIFMPAGLVSAVDVWKKRFGSGSKA